MRRTKKIKAGPFDPEAYKRWEKARTYQVLASAERNKAKRERTRKHTRGKATTEEVVTYYPNATKVA